MPTDGTRPAIPAPDDAKTLRAIRALGIDDAELVTLAVERELVQLGVFTSDEIHEQVYHNGYHFYSRHHRRLFALDLKFFQAGNDSPKLDAPKIV